MKQLTFTFSGKWADFMALARAMRGIKGSFFRKTPTRFYRNEAGVLEEYRVEKI